MQKIPLILTRPDGANVSFAADFPKSLANRLRFVDCPLLRIVGLDVQVSMTQDAIAIFTSVNGVRFAPSAAGRKAYCVGVRTTQAAIAAGWDAVCAGQNAEELREALIAASPERPLYHLCGIHVRGEIVETLLAAGLNARRISVYDQQLLPLTPAAHEVLSEEEPVIVPLFSPRAAAHFAAIAPFSPRLHVVTISRAVSDALGNSKQFKVLIAEEPTGDAVVSSVDTLVKTISLG